MISVNTIEPPNISGLGWDPYLFSDYPYFKMIAYDGSYLCGSYCGYMCVDNSDPDYPEYEWRSGWAKWSLSGGVPSSYWNIYEDYWEYRSCFSGCGSNSIIIGDQIWSFGEYHDALGCEEPNPEKNAMYYNPSWRQTEHSEHYVDPDFDFYKYGSFYRGRYGEGFSYNHTEKQIAKHNDKFYVTLSPYGPGSHADMVGVHEMTFDGIYRNVHLV